jgi:signal transduction histidine kinase
MLTIGRDLISSETVALTELVKNSFDADASYVLVRVSGEVVGGEISAGTGCIEVLDNGSGMDADRIEETWLVPATDFRKEHQRSTKGRRTLGEKGVGRFAAAKLADGLVLSSRPAADDEVTVRLNWSDFDQPDKYLDEIEIDWSVGDAQLFTSAGRVAQLWRDAWEAHVRGLKGSTPPKRPRATRGTYLKMNGLSNAWDAGTVATTRRSLARLISPFADQSAQPFTIILDVPPGLGSGGIVEPPEELDKPHYRLEATVSASGRVSGAIQSKRSNKKRTFEPFVVVDDDGEARDDERPLACGPFTVNLRVWDRDAASLASLGPSVTSVRRTLDEAAGISVYRDGFRVLPYGEREDDWLRLDLRRVQNPTMRLSNNQIVGYVSIGRDTNPELVDQTNREGLVGGEALDDLRLAVRQVLAELEKIRYAERPRPGPRKKGVGGLLDRVDLTELKDAIAERLPKDKELAQMVVDLQGEIDVKTDEVGQALARYHRMATLGGIIDRIVHEITQPLSVVRSRAGLALRDIERAPSPVDDDPCQELVEKLEGHLETIRDQGKAVGVVVNRIEPFGGRQRGRPPTFELEAAISNAVELLRPDIERVGATIELPAGATKVTIDGVELQEVLFNLLQNSLHWLRRVKPRGARRIAISVERMTDRSLAITHEDSGPGVPEDIEDRIFEPYFTTRDGGAGLGLAIAGEIVEDFYGGTLELLPAGDLGGARFRATLRKRVGK